ncbi:UDP-N-acetylmuramoyl-L-alanine--D-glutamate ligase [Leptolyngbya sp. FACHB-261]|uniref:UDP-N-acetylmuramoyl-L-alanine--D-glutamate ligase n=1 Tax=Leptolyngbya sp. FACHB-261 TaxID=2692806 RepID=UPI00168838D4|nr:UDP-N-acetylmuramoyl-L-alanine--D-glutamate ligase [Leptolyngbya sp. FACHB-261]MBD2100306.1 UDP-N-acetylmuramoyl-L-alanine--D-glutamate ligase [Leptolyngbya sp. FACHB-261]
MSSAHIIGLGASGLAAARLLHMQGWQVSVSDRGKGEVLNARAAELAPLGIEAHLNADFNPDTWTEPLPQMLVVSPGVPWDRAGLMRARELGIETIGEVELAWRYLHRIPWIGITGTNGKTTTTALTAAIFQAAGHDAPACGNIGYPLCELAYSVATTGRSPDWIVAELSSYQIESAPSVAPYIGIWTTFTPDHLSRHGTLERYSQIKAHLVENSQHIVLNGNDDFLAEHGPVRWPSAYWVSTEGPSHLPAPKGFYIRDGWVMDHRDRVAQPIVPTSFLKMPGQHNRANLLMAVAAARLAGIQPDAIAHAVEQFPGLPHRLERICTWRGIDFINDSKATNYDAALVGLSAVTAPVILIAGGEPKVGSDDAWLQAIQRKVATVLLIGAASPQFAQRLAAVGYNQVEMVETLDRAVLRAAELAQAYKDAVVLFSPACASFDQYRNFEQRGDHFRQLCLEFCA